MPLPLARVISLPLYDGSLKIGVQIATHLINIKLIYQLREVVKSLQKKFVCALNRSLKHYLILKGAWRSSCFSVCFSRGNSRIRCWFWLFGKTSCRVNLGQLIWRCRVPRRNREVRIRCDETEIYHVSGTLSAPGSRGRVGSQCQIGQPILQTYFGERNHSDGLVRSSIQDFVRNLTPKVNWFFWSLVLW